MKTILATTVASALLAAMSFGPAEAGKRGGDHGFRGHHSEYHGDRHHHGPRGYWRDGKWIALGIAGAAVLDSLNDDDCYRTRRGHVVCE